MLFMAPIVLKLSNGSNMLKDLNGDNMDELQDTWRVCTKAKQALEQGSRLENISWRRWFLSVQKHTTKQQQPKPPVVSLENQYKRNLLLQQRKQLLMATTMDSGTVATSMTTIPTDLVDIQYQPALPSKQQPTHIASITTTNNDNTFTSKDDDYTLTCFDNSFNLPTMGDTHPAMYVASDEPDFSAVQHNTLQYRFDLPSHPSPMISYPTIITASALSSFTSPSPSSSIQPCINKKPKKQKHRLRRPLPVMNADGDGKTVCYDCGTSFTPLWRRHQNKTLCNACGLYWKLHNSPRPSHLIPSMTQPPSHHQEDASNNSSSSDSLHGNQNQFPQCSNCGTNQTTLWRRNELDGSPLCNACGLYAKLHQETRPLSMKTNVIRKRQRL